MNAEIVSRAVAAATSLVVALDLPVGDAEVIHNSNKLALRLLPCDVLARIALVGQEVAAFEVEIAQRLGAIASPVAALEPRVEPRVYKGDGFAVTLWTYYVAVTPDEVSPADYADALHRLHAGMRSVEVATPHFTERVAEAERLVANRDETPALAEADRDLLASTLQSVHRKIQSRGAAEQLLHGEPHPGNVLNTQDGPLFVDFETCCRGPIEFDVAHVPHEVGAHYPYVDKDLLQECRRLVLAMVAAWRWDVRDQFPNGHQHGRDILALLRGSTVARTRCSRLRVTVTRRRRRPVARNRAECRPSDDSSGHFGGNTQIVHRSHEVNNMDSNTALEALWELEGRLTDSAGAMEKEATSKSLSTPAAEKLAARAEGIKLARSFVWDAIRERTNARPNGSHGVEG